MPISDFLDFMPDTVTIYRWLSGGVSGAPTYSSSGAPYSARIEMKNRLVISSEGREVLARGRVILGTMVAPSVKDKIVLPSEYIPISPPILAVNLVSDEDGAHHVVLEIG